MKNEKSSKRVASIAGKLSLVLAKAEKSGCKFLFTSDSQHVLLADVQAVVGSALSQAPDKTDSYLKVAAKHADRLGQIAGIIEAVGNRCMAHDGPVTDELKEITKTEFRKIYRLAKGRK